MVVVGAQALGQFPGTAQADRATLDVQQQGRAIQALRRRQGFQATIGDQQNSLLLRRQATLTLLQPSTGFDQGLGQRRTTAGAKVIEPVPQVPGSLQALDLPARSPATGGQQGQSRPLPVGVVEQLRQQALGIAQGMVAASGRRGVDDHQPQLMGRSTAQAPAQFLVTSRAPLEQGAWPIDAACVRGPTAALTTTVQLPRPGLGIRPRVRPGTDA